MLALLVNIYCHHHYHEDYLWRALQIHSSIYSTSCLSQKLLDKIKSLSLSPCLCQNYLINFHHRRLRHVYVTNYSTNYRHHLMFMAINCLSEWFKLLMSADANVSTKQNCISQTPSHTIHHQSCVPCGDARRFYTILDSSLLFHPITSDPYNKCGLHLALTRCWITGSVKCELLA